ncbi:MAG: NYN domain-containing protein [Chloroflexi bacterium]|nr:NYN domain-containing protein [Chloroflexota bacterium]
MVKFFGKPRKDTRKSKTAGDASTNGAAAAAPPGPPAKRATATKAASTAAAPATTAASPAATSRTAAASAAGGTTATKTTTSRTRRAPVTRPPRRDWAAEAAAVPMGTPSPVPSSLAVAPSLDDLASPAKRRRGTRGGRGRKKPGALGDGAAAEDLSQLPELEAGTLEAVVAHQAAVLEQFTREIGATLKSLQTTISDLQGRVGDSGPVTAHPRVGIFVDVPNLIYAAERRKIDLDFGRVLEYFTRGRELVRATAYAPITDDPQAKLESQRFAHHFIAHPYRIVTKPLKRFSDGSMKANFDIELAVDILTMSERLDVVVLMSGDGDFVRVVELVESRGVRVEVCAFAEAAATELRGVADRFIDIGQHIEEFKTKK